MSSIPITLIQDPVLRSSLRKLYPEFPRWLRRWLIATPNREAPLPPEFTHPAWDSQRAATQALEATCARWQTVAPRMTWTPQIKAFAHRVEGWIQHPLGEYPRDHAAMEGSVVGWTIVDTCVESVRFQCGDAHLTIAYRYTPRVDLALSVDSEVRFAAYYNRQGTKLGRRLANGEPLLADGSGLFLVTTDFCVGLEQESDTLDHDAQKPDEAAAPLVRRWQALRSAADQRRIAAFWLGHPHPVLATAGLMALGTQVLQHRRAAARTPAGGR